MSQKKKKEINIEIVHGAAVKTTVSMFFLKITSLRLTPKFQRYRFRLFEGSGKQLFKHCSFNQCLETLSAFGGNSRHA